MRRLPHGQVFFYRGDQLGNADGLGEKWMPLDISSAFLGGQPSDEPGAQESDYYAD